MRAIIDYDKNLMFFKQVTTQELAWLEDHLSWYNREGSLRDLKEGDYVQETGSKKVGVFKGQPGEKLIAYKLFDGTEKETQIYDVIPVAKETLLYKNKQGIYYTLAGLKKVIEDESGFKVELENPKVNKYERFTVNPHCLTGIELADFQVSCIAKSLMLRRGLLTVPTGGGKTEIMLAIIQYLIAITPTDEIIIVINPTILLAEQFKARSVLRGFDPGMVGVVSGSTKEYQCKVLTFTMASLLLALRAKKPEVMRVLDKVKHLFIDETHHLRCTSMVEILKLLPPVTTLIGVSGSPFTIKEPFNDSGDTLMWGLTGGPIFDVPYEYLVKIGFIARPIVHMKKIEGKLLKYPGRFQKIYDSFIVKHDRRNELIAKYAQRAVEMGFKVLILVQRLPHAADIMNRLRDEKVISVFGGETSMTFDENTGDTITSKIDYNDFREEFESGGYTIAIGSTVADEGLDLPSVGFVLMAGGGKSRIKVLQRLGRGLRRKKDGQNVVYVVDFKDMGHVYLNAHSNSRLKLYKEADADHVEEEILFWQKAHIHAKQLATGAKNASKPTA